MLEPFRRNVPHHCIDIANPDELVDASVYCSYAEHAVSEIVFRGKIPLIVGGSGLYLDSFLKGMSPVPDIDPSVRQQLNEELSQNGLSALRTELEKCDPLAAKKIHPNDSQRILRAVQVYRGTGRPLSEYQNNRKGRESSKTAYIGLSLERDELDKRIEKRVDVMIDSGFLGEVKGLIEKGYSSNCNSMRSIGYHELLSHIEGHFSLDETVKRIKSETKWYARRQETWFKRNKRINWYMPTEHGLIMGFVSQWLKEADSFLLSGEQAK